MSDVPPPNLSDANSPRLQQIFALFGRGLIYAVAFWLVYLGLFRIYPGTATTEADERLRQRYATQQNTYEEQARRADEMFVESERQQARMNAYISKQEELTKRFDAVLERWEKQTGIRK
jgi:hypothetical protein